MSALFNFARWRTQLEVRCWMISLSLNQNNRMREFFLKSPIIVSLLLVTSILLLGKVSHVLFQYDNYNTALLQGICTVGIILYFRKHFTDYELHLNSDEKIKVGYWGLTILLAMLFAFTLSQTFGFQWIGVQQVSVNLSVAIFEEGILRAICFSLLLIKLKNNPNYIIRSGIYSALLFSVLHLFSLFSHKFSIELLTQTAIQLIYAFLLGVAFAGITFKTRTIWIAVSIHFLIDLYGDTDKYFPNDTRFEDNILISVVTPLAYLIIIIAGLFFLIRPSKTSIIPNAN